MPPSATTSDDKRGPRCAQYDWVPLGIVSSWALWEEYKWGVAGDKLGCGVCAYLASRGGGKAADVRSLIEATYFLVDYGLCLVFVEKKHECWGFRNLLIRFSLLAFNNFVLFRSNLSFYLLVETYASLLFLIFAII
jgi:hypothetical protein